MAILISYITQDLDGLLWPDTDNRQIIPMKSRGFLQTPQGIIEEYSGRSVP